MYTGFPLAPGQNPPVSLCSYTWSGGFWGGGPYEMYFVGVSAQLLQYWCSTFSSQPQGIAIHAWCDSGSISPTAYFNAVTSFGWNATIYSDDILHDVPVLFNSMMGNLQAPLVAPTDHRHMTVNEAYGYNFSYYNSYFAIQGGSTELAPIVFATTPVSNDGSHYYRRIGGGQICFSEPMDNSVDPSGMLILDHDMEWQENGKPHWHESFPGIKSDSLIDFCYRVTGPAGWYKISVSGAFKADIKKGTLLLDGNMDDPQKVAGWGQNGDNYAFQFQVGDCDP